MNKRKVLCLLQLSPPVHGVTQMNDYIVKSRYLREKMDLSVVSLNFASSIKDVGVARPAKFLLMLKVIFKLIRAIIKLKPKTVYFTISPTGKAFYRDLVFSLIFKAFRVKNIIFHLHGKGIAQVTHKRIQKALYRWVFNKSKIILLSPLLVFDVKDVVAEDNIFFLPNSIPRSIPPDKLEFACLERRDRAVCRIVFLSNMIRNKGPIVLLRALDILAKEGHDFQACFAGSWFGGDCKAEFYSVLLDSHLAGYVQYLGPQYGNEKTELLLSGDIFVFPTYGDVFGIVNLEAMEAGLPVISTYEGAISEVIENGVTGYLVPKQDHVALAEKIRILLDNPDLRIRMGDAGRKKFEEQYAFEVYEKKLSEILMRN